MPMPICIQCGLFFRVQKNGITWEERIRVSDDEWRPYKLWQADLWECRGCGTQILTGHGQKPIAEYFENNYYDIRDRFVPMLRVDDDPT
jgi:hypothetical protein